MDIDGALLGTCPLETKHDEAHPPTPHPVAPSRGACFTSVTLANAAFPVGIVTLTAVGCAEAIFQEEVLFADAAPAFPLALQAAGGASWKGGREEKNVRRLESVYFHGGRGVYFF